MRPSEFFLGQDFFWWLHKGAPKKPCEAWVLSDCRENFAGSFIDPFQDLGILFSMIGQFPSKNFVRERLNFFGPFWATLKIFSLFLSQSTHFWAIGPMLSHLQLRWLKTWATFGHPKIIFIFCWAILRL